MGVNDDGSGQDLAMNVRELINILADENPPRKVVIDLGGFKVEALDVELCEHEGELSLEITAGPRDPDEDLAIENHGTRD